MSRNLSVVALLLAVVARAGAQPQAAPFEADELRQALESRVPAWVQTELRTESHEGMLTLTLRNERREIALEGAQGPEAARVVALVAADMAEKAQRDAAAERERRDAATESARRDAATESARRHAVTESARRHAATSPAEQPAAPDWPRWHARDRFRLALDAAVQRGAVAAEPWIFDVGIGASALLRERWLLALRAGYWGSPSERSTLSLREIRLHGLSARVLGGVRLRTFEIGAGPVVAPFWAVVEHQSRSRVLVGGCLQLSVALPLSTTLRMLARLQLDILGNRTEVTEGGIPIFTTPHFMPGLALGFSWGWS